MHSVRFYGDVERMYNGMAVDIVCIDSVCMYSSVF